MNDPKRGIDVKEVIQEVASFFRFDLRRKGFVIDTRPSEEGWEVQAELLDPRPDLSSSYKQVYDQNIYRVRLTGELKILSCEKIGTREKTGEIRFFIPEKTRRKPVPSRVCPPKESISEKSLSLDPSVVGNLADEISRRVSSSLSGKYKSPSPPKADPPLAEEDEPSLSKEAFVDPHQEVDLDFNFQRIGKLDAQEEGNISEAVEMLKEINSKKDSA